MLALISGVKFLYMYQYDNVLCRRVFLIEHSDGSDILFLFQKVKIRDVDSEKPDDKTPDVLNKIPDISKLLTVRRLNVNLNLNVKCKLYMQYSGHHF